MLLDTHTHQDDYDPDKIPFDMNEAIFHRKASTTRAEIELEKINDDLH